MPSEVSVRCFLTAARHGSFTKAAEELYMTRQAVSQQIAALEKELGVRLFNRTTAKISLTAVGELYINYFNDVIRQWNEVRQKAEAITKRENTTIRVGCLHDADLRGKISVLSENERESEPLFSISWERREAHELTELLLKGKYDVVFTFDETYLNFPQKDKLNCFSLGRVQALLAVHRSYPLAVSGASAKDFENAPCYLAEGTLHGNQPCLEFENVFASCGLHFSDVHIVPNRETVQTMVETCNGFTICTDAERFIHFPGIVTYPIDMYLDICCIWRRDETRAWVLAFVDSVHK